MNKDSFYVAVNKDGSEVCAWNLRRVKTIIVDGKKTFQDENDLDKADCWDGDEKQFLPKGIIVQLIGKELRWEDGAFEVR